MSADEALVVTANVAIDGPMVNVGVSGTAENTASIGLVNCTIEVTGEVGDRTFSSQAQRDRLSTYETWEWEVFFGEEADALHDNQVENVSITTRAEYTE